MKPFFCRVGTKRDIAPRIISYFPEHQTYVEPFIGGGAVYFAKPPSPHEVINDIEKPLIAGYRALKTLKDRDFPNLDTVSKLQAYFNKPARTPKQQLVREIINLCAGFRSMPIDDSNNKKVYRDINPLNKLKKIDEYQERLKNTTILNQDYMKVVRRYDSPTTLFFLDPPYEDSEGLYENDVIDYAAMDALLKGLRGKFILSINNSPRIRKIFKDHHQKRIVVKRTPNASSGPGRKSRSELLISNFPLK